MTNPHCRFIAAEAATERLLLKALPARRSSQVAAL